MYALHTLLLCVYDFTESYIGTFSIQFYTFPSVNIMMCKSKFSSTYFQRNNQPFLDSIKKMFIVMIHGNLRIFCFLKTSFPENAKDCCGKQMKIDNMAQGCF